ncbi:MAG: hypothetical protein ACU0A9_00580 [Alterinioella nitratireducens]|uniref:hypothetical protein n=1 Tax=Alterinioella nitratireducens TaxID=2735915 RepID=UPI00405A0FA3
MRLRIQRRPAAVAALIALALVAGYGALSSEPGPQVTCRALPGAIAAGSAAHLDGLCAALRDMVPTTGPAAETGLELVVTGLRDAHVSAHLQWQGQAGAEQGPTVDFGFLDTGLGPAQYGFVITGLLQATNMR